MVRYPIYPNNSRANYYGNCLFRVRGLFGAIGCVISFRGRGLIKKIFDPSVTITYRAALGADKHSLVFPAL